MEEHRGPYEVDREGLVPMETRDGVTLRADIYRPRGDGPFPTLLRPTATYSSTIGATDGVIIPIIITSHIANMNAKCAAVHGMKCGDIIADMSKPVPNHQV